MNITENITRLKASLPAGVTLVAVSKFHPVEALQEAYNAGQRVFGESRAQELTAKQKVLPSDMAFYRPIAKQQGKRHCPVHPHDTQYRLVKTFAGSQQASG